MTGIVLTVAGLGALFFYLVKKAQEPETDAQETADQLGWIVRATEKITRDPEYISPDRELQTFAVKEADGKLRITSTLSAIYRVPKALEANNILRRITEGTTLTTTGTENIERVTIMRKKMSVYWIEVVIPEGGSVI